MRRKCPKCEVWKNRSRFPRKRKRNGKGYYRRGVCIVCYNLHWKIRRACKGSAVTRASRLERVNGTCDGSLTPEALEELLKLYTHCPYCLAKLRPWTVSFDHMEPLGLGGSHTLSNIMVCCSDCNRLKGCLSWDDWFSGLRREAQEKLMEDPRCQLGWAGV